MSTVLWESSSAGKECEIHLTVCNRRLLSAVYASFHIMQIMAITGGMVETLDDIPAHVWKGLPDCLSLGPSAVNQSRVGELKTA